MFQVAFRRAALSIAPAAIFIFVFAFILISPRVSAQDDKKAGQDEVRLIQSLKGPELYQAYCASCHGKDAKGAGPAAPALKVKPADLTQIAKASGGKFPSDRIQKIIAGDEPVKSAHGSRAMPVWGPIFGQIAWDQDLGRVRIYNLAKYLESLQAK